MAAGAAAGDPGALAARARGAARAGDAGGAAHALRGLARALEGGGEGGGGAGGGGEGTIGGAKRVDSGGDKMQGVRGDACERRREPDVINARGGGGGGARVCAEGVAG